MYRIILYVLLVHGLLCIGAKGCERITVEIPPDVGDDTDGEEDTDEPWYCEDYHPPCGEHRCEDVGEDYFGPCEMLLGWAVAYGECQPIGGCLPLGFPFFDSEEACHEECFQEPTDEELCERTGGCWDEISCGHYICGEFPLCDAIIPGCDCGPKRNFQEGKGCVFDPSCLKEPNCEDLSHVDFGACEMLMGWGVIDGRCQAISGCDPKGYVFFESLEECRHACEKCESNEDCANVDYCQFPPETHCGADGPGGCVPRPWACPDVYQPVCGCDGNTYGNACDAGWFGVSVKHEGECETEPDCVEHSDCCLHSFYCFGCDCLAMPCDSPLPMCPDIEWVDCFADPCQFKKPACIEGTCVALPLCQGDPSLANCR